MNQEKHLQQNAEAYEEEREANETAELDAYLDELLAVQHELTKMGEQS